MHRAAIVVVLYKYVCFGKMSGFNPEKKLILQIAEKFISRTPVVVETKK